MKRAWNIFHGNNPYSLCFSDSLKRAWEVEKEIISSKNNEESEFEPINTLVIKASEWDVIMRSEIIDYYRNSNSGKYFGD